ncbi:MAG: molecular chaperone DnaJ [Gammaproteobacteria bacterium]|nr:molecular chaperone DnaJ [Gammaproteobacteria bacterium]
MKLLIIIITSLFFCSTNLLAGDVNSIGYPSVSEALEKLTKHPSANISQQGGWTIISLIENGNHVIWFFAPEEHAAHPAMVKRTILEKNGSLEIKMVSFCQAPKQKCDELSKQFENLNKQFK